MEGVSTQNTRRSGSRPGGQQKPKAAQRRAAKPSAGTVRQRQVAQQALLEARRAREGRNRRLWTVLAPIAVAVLAVTVLVAVKLASDNGPKSGKAGAVADPAVIAQVTGVPASVFDAVGAGKPYALPSRIDAPITADGKPRVLYIGAEYCPFCAVERWALIVALSRFGTWHGLDYAYSAAAPEVYPNTATFSFHGASFTSKYLSFTGVETHTNKRQGDGYAPLDKLSNGDLAIMQAHDPQGATPFMDIGGQHSIIGATYDPKLIVDRTQAQIAATLSDPNSATGAGIIGAANMITAAVCESTGGQPGDVCTSSGVTAAAKALP
jgi:hypothetical protein